jgi:hypothetical protein
VREKPYYSIRTGKNPLSRSIDLPTLLRLFRSIYEGLRIEGYFQQDLGYHCVDAGFVPGTLGYDIEGFMLLELRKSNLYPIAEQLGNYTEDDLFDIIEFLYDHCSKPTKRTYHSYGDCGWHCTAFDREPGKVEYRQKINRILRTYGDGFELTVDGEILALPDYGLEPLLEAPLPQVDPENIEARVEAARRKFRRHRASLDERRDAIRDLADVLEYLRPNAKAVLDKNDEDDLFTLANNFDIRHHNDKQKREYDKAIWYSWMFYYYLATIHAVVRLIEKAETELTAQNEE